MLAAASRLNALLLPLGIQPSQYRNNVMSVSFIHAADLHLGLRVARFSQDAREKILEARFQALEKIREAVKETQADFLLIAGDLFDDAAVDGLTARRAHQLLESMTAPVFVLPGNHDPIQAGSVWDRVPWSDSTSGHVTVLRSREPIEISPAVTLFPCPVFGRTSLEDPTLWIADAPADQGSAIRIGVAHGSVLLHPSIPEDDHPISLDSAERLDLDYLALGHWHKPHRFKDSRGGERMAYPGVHEPLGFPEGADLLGWRPYVNSTDRDEFRDPGRGHVLHVTIHSHNTSPRLKLLETTQFSWTSRKEDVYDTAQIGKLINELATEPYPERMLLRLSVGGALSAESLRRIDELRRVLRRYVVGEFDDAALDLEPTEAELEEVLGPGVVRNVADRLQRLAKRDSGIDSQVAKRALLMLYRLGREAQESP